MSLGTLFVTLRADPPECAPNGWADLGDIVAEEFGLRIDPFPRRLG